MAELFKVVVTVPTQDADALRQAMGDAGAGKAGNYTHCSFSSKGTGRFLPVEGAKPHIGQVGKPEAVEEERIEVNCGSDTLDALLKAIRESHPYEEPAIDIYPLYKE